MRKCGRELVLMDARNESIRGRDGAGADKCVGVDV